MLWILLALAGTPPEPLRPDAPDTTETVLAPSAFTPSGELPPYWERREVVYVEAQCAPDGTVWRAEIVSSHSTRAVEDSLRLVVLGWRFPPPAQARAETPSFTELVAFAGDRAEFRAGLDGGRRLPEDLRAAFRTGALRLWSEAWREIDPRFGPDDFVAWEVGRMALATEAETPPRTGPALKVERSGARSDDPTAGLGWYGHEGGFTRESRYAAVHARSGERTYYRFTTDQDVWLAVWTSPTRFAAVGRVEILHPSETGAFLGFEVPAVWVGDITAGTVERYLGAPAAYPNRWRLLELRSDFLRRASGISEPVR